MAANTTVYAACAPYEFEQCNNLDADVPRVYVPNALTATGQSAGRRDRTE